MNGTTALTLRIDVATYEQLRQEAFDRRVTISSLIREAIRSRPKPSGGCDVCGKPHVMVSTPGGIRFCDNHKPLT